MKLYTKSLSLTGKNNNGANQNVEFKTKTPDIIVIDDDQQVNDVPSR